MINAESVLRHFDRISDAPDAVGRIRRFVLELAVRGKLVDQDPHDEAAVVAVRKTQGYRRTLEKQKAIRPVRLPYGRITVGQEYPLPRRWAISTLAELCELQTGATPDRTRAEYFGGDIPWLRSGDINKGDIFECDGRISSQGLNSSNCKLLPKNSVLIALNGQGKTRGTVAILHLSATCNQSLVAIIPLAQECLSSEWLRLNLKSRYNAIRELTGQDDRRGLNMRLISCFAIAVPPLAEQRRIVAKVDELMALCDRLAAAQREREDRRDQLLATSLNRWNNPASDVAVFRHDVCFQLDHLPRLITQSRHVDDLRQSILTLAVRGQLARQEPADEPATDLHKYIRSKKAASVADAERKKKSWNIDDDTQEPFQLPRHWIWCPIDELAARVTDGEHLTPHREAAGRVLLSARNVKNDAIDVGDVDYVGEAEYQRIRKRCNPDKGDILVSCSGSVGRVAIVDKDDAYVMVRSVALIKLYPDSLSPEYLGLALRSQCLQAQMAKRSKMTAQANLFIGAIKRLLVPVPPLAEQYRIVTKVRELMRICDQLEAAIALALTERHRLLEAVLFDALGSLSGKGTAVSDVDRNADSRR